MQKELEEAISRTQKIVFEKLNELVPEDKKQQAGEDLLKFIASDAT